MFENNLNFKCISPKQKLSCELISKIKTKIIRFLLIGIGQKYLFCIVPESMKDFLKMTDVTDK